MDHKFIEYFMAWVYGLQIMQSVECYWGAGHHGAIVV